ncbi:MAG: DpnD/PcfM family protein [Candidatus Coproplasma sp.]
MTFKIEITETLQKVVEVEAKTLSEALTTVGQDYDKGEIVLDSMDFVKYEIKQLKEA